jgi:hypothetical protein
MRQQSRYFLVDSDEPSVLWERWFHLKDVVKDLPPFIKEFNESEENKTGRRGEGSFVGEKAAYKPKDVTLPKPINLDDYIHKNLDEIK